MDLSIVENVVNILIDKGWHISFAESCTAGLAVARLVSIPNASKVLNASVVTYSNEAKSKYANVNKSTLDKYGAVSEQVALEMAIGIAKNTNSEVGIGISGIAGPTGGTKNKSVGTVCFGFAIGDKHFAKTMHFGNIGRDNVRTASVDFVYNTLYSNI